MLKIHPGEKVKLNKNGLDFIFDDDPKCFFRKIFRGQELEVLAVICDSTSCKVLLRQFPDHELELSEVELIKGGE